MASVPTTLDFCARHPAVCPAGPAEGERRMLAVIPTPRTAAPRERRFVPVTGSPTLDCAQAAELLAPVSDVRSLIARMRNTTPATASDF
ncbi:MULTISPECIES: hypothetical protein [unclassified Streptomyces]|uniref:hypothetical protein n=1 Tax=unclassified Streptomyces TaxID=2593676 RepID=UPI0036E6D1DD